MTSFGGRIFRETIIFWEGRLELRDFLAEYYGIWQKLTFPCVIGFYATNPPELYTIWHLVQSCESNKSVFTVSKPRMRLDEFVTLCIICSMKVCI